MKEYDEIYRAIFNEARDGLVLIDKKTGSVFDCNPEFEKQTGRRLEHLKKMKIWELVPAEKIEIAKKRFYEIEVKETDDSGELEFQKPDGNIIPIEFVNKVIEIRGKQFICSITKDIIEKKKTEEQIRYLSNHDKLTGLYNRAYFEEEIKRLDVERQLPLSVVIGDINGLKLVNDAFGHSEGDKLLSKMAKIIKDLCREEDIIARWGGDEFAVILPGTNEKAAHEVCDRIKKAFSKADNEPIFPNIALGIATKVKFSQDIQQVVREAENRMYRKKLVESEITNNSFISSLMKRLVERNYESEEHIQRLRQMAMQIGYTIGLSDSELEKLTILSSLHDIGNLAIPDSILMKPDTLSTQEWGIMKKHPEIGYRIVQSSNGTAFIAKAILTHHERWDGAGYPMGLSGNEIPFVSRIFAIIDAYDAMTHDRVYRKAICHKEALDELKRCAGTQFDPKLVEIFTEMDSL